MYRGLLEEVTQIEDYSDKRGKLLSSRCACIGGPNHCMFICGRAGHKTRCMGGRGSKQDIHRIPLVVAQLNLLKLRTCTINTTVGRVGYLHRTNFD